MFRTIKFKTFKVLILMLIFVTLLVTFCRWNGPVKCIKATPFLITQATAKSLGYVFRIYKEDNGDYPEESKEVDTFNRVINEGYMSRSECDTNGLVLDGWGRPFEIYYENGGIVIHSLGEDGILKTEDDKYFFVEDAKKKTN